MAKKKSFVGKFLAKMSSRIFCHRNIIVITDHKSEHYPVSLKSQLAVFVGFMAFIIWVSFSTGSYMSAQSIIQKQQEKIVSASMENRRIESEFEMIKRDLVKLVDQNDGSLSDYTKFVVNQYSDGDSSTDTLEQSKAVNTTKLVDTNMIFERIAYLEKQITEIAQNHVIFVDAVRATTENKIREFEKVIKTTGLDLKKIEASAAREMPKKNAIPNKEIDGGTGGPFVPVDILQKEDKDLFSSMQRMIWLHDIAGKLPIEYPAYSRKVTSGYGTRIDPFRHLPARHTGIDFAGGYGSKIMATASGTVIHAGPMSAYGNTVDIAHGFGITTRYAHMSSVKVVKGQKIKKGMLIGLEGSTGRSTGSHLHYEVRLHDNPMNPRNFINAGEKYVQAKRIR